MSSPLGWFRRHQKGMMVVFGMVLMAIFGLGSVAMMINPSSMSDPVANKVAVKWDGGQLKQSQVDNLRVRHFAAGRFINGVEQAAFQKKATFRSVALPIQWMTQNMDPRRADIMISERYIMAERAKKEGIRISDAMVNDYISLVHNLVDFSPAQLEAINAEVNGGFVDIVDIRRQLKIELAAQQYRILLNTGLPDAPTPTEAAELYSKLEKTIECSVLPLKVEDYLDKVTEQPTNTELKKIFAEGQYRLADPNGLEPGFKRAKRVKINYVTADYEDFMTAEKLKITDAEVQEEYKRLVDADDPLVLEIVPPTDGPEVDAPKIDDEDAAPTPDGDAAPKPPGDEEANQESADENEKKEESAGDSTEQKKEDNESEKEGNGEDDQVILSNVKPHFVSTLQEEENQEKTEQETTSGSENTNQDEGSSNDPETTQNENAAENQEGDDAPPMLEEEGGDESTTPLPGESDQQDPVSPILTRPKELDSVLSDLIREKMVGDKALRAMQRVISEAQADVREQQYDYSEWSSMTDAEKKNTEPNITLDLKEMADRLRLQYGETELLNRNQLLKDAGFGERRGIVEIPQQFGPARRTDATLAAIVYSQLEEMSVYQPGDPVVELGSQTNILWWPVEIKEMEILKFAEAKDNVIAFWKLQKARELAREDAIRIAGELNGNGNKLMDYSDKAQNTGSFTWYLTGLVRPQGVTTPGEEFMSTAFDLKIDECGGALNEAGDYAYVIQKIIEDTRSDQDITDSLLTNWSKFQMVPPNVSSTSQQESSALRSATQRSIAEEMNVNWVAE